MLMEWIIHALSLEAEKTGAGRANSPDLSTREKLSLSTRPWTKQIPVDSPGCTW